MIIANEIYIKYNVIQEYVCQAEHHQTAREDETFINTLIMLECVKN